MISFKHLVSILLMLPLVACVKASREAPGELSEEVSAFGLERSLIPYNNRALFEAGNVQLEDIQWINDTETPNERPNRFRIWLKICGIRDRGTQGTIRNEKFMISSELGDNIYLTKDGPNHDLVNTGISNPITVNSENCLRWSQQAPFNFFATSINLALHYEIKSLNGSLGTMVRRVSINPWDKKRSHLNSQSFLDHTDHDRKDWFAGEYAIGPDAVIAALKGDLYKNDARLAMRNFSVELVERFPQDSTNLNEREDPSLKYLFENDRAEYERFRERIDQEARMRPGMQITVNMKAQPFVLALNSTNMPTNIDLTTGRFKIFMNLVAEGAGEDKQKVLLSSNLAKIAGRSSSFVWEVRDANALQASVPLLLERQANHGRILLAIKVVPLNPDLRDLKPFEAVYNLGNPGQWTNAKSPLPAFDDNFQPLDDINFDEFVRSGIVDDTDLSAVRQQDRYYFEPLDIRFVRIMPGETATDRTLQYGARTCINHGLYGVRALRGLRFEVETVDQGEVFKEVRETNEKGCLMWFGFLSHKYYRKEVLEKKIAKVKFVGVRKSQDQSEELINPFEKEYVYYMNPWDEKFTFGWDGDEPNMPTGYAQQLEDQRENAPVSRLFIPDFKYQTMGFRYEIDKFLKLKVKKAVLLQAYPMVLKYNSIVEGRKKTERLRDGIYLMKVALHKYYLDPAARGVRIYHKDNPNPYCDHNIKDGSLPEDLKEKKDPSLFDYRVAYCGDDIFNGQNSPSPQLSLPPGQVNSDNLSYRLLTDKDLEEATKEFVSTQTKLVRVLGGQIITPIEFEIEDLRLMRIRNQFLIQLQTIDERKLRLANFIDRSLTDMARDAGLVNGDDNDDDSLSRLNQIFQSLDELNESNEEIETLLSNHQKQIDQSNIENELKEKGADFDELISQLKNMLGLNLFERGTPQYEAHLERINQLLIVLDEARKKSRLVGQELTDQNAFRNSRRRVIDNTIRSLSDFAEDGTDLDKFLSDYGETRNLTPEEADENLEALKKDPFLRYMFMDNMGLNSIDEIMEYRKAMGYPTVNTDLDSLRFADFIDSPLTANFDIELLLNDGEHDPNQSPDDGKSGLPSRTFVGPLTFLFNTNGSALRPTDILNELFCTDAFCETPKIAKSPWNTERSRRDNFKNDADYNIDMGIPPAPVELSAKPTESLDPKSHFDFSADGIYSMGDSINKAYENSEYYGYLKAYGRRSVDYFIQREKELEETEFRRMEQASQIINFVKSYNLKYTLLNDNRKSRLKDVDNHCAENPNIPVAEIDQCFTDVTTQEDIFPAEDLLEQLNERLEVHDPALVYPYVSKYAQNNTDYFNMLPGDINKEDILEIMEKGWANPNMKDPDLSRRFMHRMCHVMAQNFFTSEYLALPYENPYLTPESVEGRDQFYDEYNQDLDKYYRSKNEFERAHLNKSLIHSIEQRCHRYVGRLYGYYSDQDVGRLFNKMRWETRGKERAKETGLRPLDSTVRFNPVIMERKVRVYETTGGYIYRGGKSLNISVAANFSLAAGDGAKLGTTGSWKPWEQAVGIGSPLVGLAAGFFVGGPAGAAVGLAGGLALTPTAKTVVSGFTLTRSYGRDASVYQNDGTNVSATTFLVNQQATVDIELGEYERCMVVRLHPMLIKDIMVHEPLLQERFGELAHEAANNIETDGILICSGEPKKDCPLPVKEKYYYFTQHFTEGDMLDMADLHNHPWLLQMRGYRDFKVFTSTIGATEVGYLDNGWASSVASRIISDATSFRLDSSAQDNLKPEFEVVARDEFNWALDELSRTYFDVMPTFPSLYTYLNESGESVADWPYSDTDPGSSFPKCQE